MVRWSPSPLPPPALARGARPPLQAAKLTDFKLGGALGAGTTSKVHAAVHIATGRHVAIKILEPSQSDTEMRERFAREAVLLGTVASRHVGAILGFGFERGQPFLVLERLHGETLDAKLRRDGPIPPVDAMRWIEELLIGVRDCHDAQIIHRDIKPSNIFVHTDGPEHIVKLIDFGTARLREITGDTAALTETNHLIGSMGYMAPEQFSDPKAVGFTADLYTVGVVIFRTLTGRLPFVSRTLEAVIRMKAEQAVPAVSSMPGMPSNFLLDWLVTKAMSRDPADRFQTSREMLEHWWNVMSSFDDDTNTDVMRGMGRVDESYEGVSPAAAPLPPPEERTLRRIPAMTGPTEVVPLMASTSTNADGTLHDLAPATERGAGGSGASHEDDLPTRSNPNLRKLVERELELQRKRKGSLP